MDVRVRVGVGNGLLSAAFCGSCRTIDAVIIGVESVSVFGSTICIKCAAACRNNVSIHSPVLAETKNANISRSLANSWCLSALTARKC